MFHIYKKKFENNTYKQIKISMQTCSQVKKILLICNFLISNIFSNITSQSFQKPRILSSNHKKKLNFKQPLHVK